MIELGEIRVAASGVRRFLLFESLPQFLSWVTIIALMSVAGTAIVTLLDGTHEVPFGVLAGGIGGALPAVWLARQASFRVRGPARAQAWAVLEGRICAGRYRAAGVEQGVHLFRPKLPRWLRWDEQDLRLSMDREGMLVTGPYGALLGLRRLLAVTFGD